MKYVFSLFGLSIFLVAIFCFRAVGGGDVVAENDYMRIHVVGNSSEKIDEEAKYLVKDAVVEFLIPLLSEVENAQDAESLIFQNLNKISEVASATLSSMSLLYGVSVSICDEFVPLRSYENLTLEEGTYSTLRIELGDGEGDNWWCVVFPAVCFLDTTNPENYQYVSKIWEIIQSVL